MPLHNHDYKTENTTQRKISEGKSTNAVKGKTKVIISGKSAGLKNLRSDIEHKKCICNFTNLCLEHLCSSRNGQYKTYSSVVADIFTDLDGAFAILLTITKNNAKDYKKLMEIKKNNKKSGKTKVYNESKCEQKFRSWFCEIIRR